MLHRNPFGISKNNANVGVRNRDVSENNANAGVRNRDANQNNTNAPEESLPQRDAFGTDWHGISARNGDAPPQRDPLGKGPIPQGIPLGGTPPHPEGIPLGKAKKSNR